MLLERSRDVSTMFDEGCLKAHTPLYPIVGSIRSLRKAKFGRRASHIDACLLTEDSRSQMLRLRRGRLVVLYFEVALETLDSSSV